MLGKFEANIVDKNSKASQETIDVTKGAGGSLPVCVAHLGRSSLINPRSKISHRGARRRIQRPIYRLGKAQRLPSEITRWHQHTAISPTTPTSTISFTKTTRRTTRKRWEEWRNRKGGGTDNWYPHNTRTDVNNVTYKAVERLKGELTVCSSLTILLRETRIVALNRYNKKSST